MNSHQLPVINPEGYFQWLEAHCPQVGGANGLPAQSYCTSEDHQSPQINDMISDLLTKLNAANTANSLQAAEIAQLKKQVTTQAKEILILKEDKEELRKDVDFYIRTYGITTKRRRGGKCGHNKTMMMVKTETMEEEEKEKIRPKKRMFYPPESTYDYSLTLDHIFKKSEFRSKLPEMSNQKE